jgi:hypothetical protein
MEVEGWKKNPTLFLPRISFMRMLEKIRIVNTIRSRKGCIERERKRKRE